jgi:DNA processing protein
MSSVSERSAWLALSELASRGTRVWLDLAAQCGSASAVFYASRDRLESAGASPRRANAIRNFSSWARIEQRVRVCDRAGIRVIVFADSEYPATLRNLADPPLALYVRGSLECLAHTSVAIVGSRNASRYGRRIADRLARTLAARGVCVVSGLAFGIDGVAHEAALATGTSAAVLAGGVDVVHPRRHRELYHRLCRRGCVLSESPPGTETLPFRFPIRNRIVTGLCVATVVVEATERSGSLISARHAMEQGRDVYAVPGPIDVPTAAGTNALIRDGAIPLVSIAELVETIAGATANPAGAQPGCPADGKPAAVEVLDPEAACVFAVLDTEPASVESIAAAAGLDESVVMEKVTSLELDGLAERLAGGTYARAGRATVI